MIADMHDYRTQTRPSLYLKHTRDRIGVEGIRAESVNGFSWKSHELTVAKQFGGTPNLVLRYAELTDWVRIQWSSPTFMLTIGSARGTGRRSWPS